jgi:hypothetical protein
VFCLICSRCGAQKFDVDTGISAGKFRQTQGYEIMRFCLRETEKIVRWTLSNRTARSV